MWICVCVCVLYRFLQWNVQSRMIQESPRSSQEEVAAPAISSTSVKRRANSSLEMVENALDIEFSLLKCAFPWRQLPICRLPRHQHREIKLWWVVSSVFNGVGLVFKQKIMIIKWLKNIDTLHTWTDWHFDGKWVKYIELYIQMPDNSMSDHLHEIILVRSCRDHFTFVLNEKFSSCFVPIGSSHLTQMAKKKKKDTGKGHLI